MKILSEMRDQLSSIVDLDFVINIGNAELKYDDEQIAESIRGANYRKTNERINDFVDRCNQTLNDIEDRVQQIKDQYETILSEAHSQAPGSPPSDFWVDRKDPNSVAKYNEKVDRYNNQLDVYHRLMDKANRAKERHEDALERYKDKKAEFESQIDQKFEELEPALEQDIIVFLDKMMQIISDDLQNQSEIFRGFVFIYLAKRTYSFLSDRVNTANERRSASDIIKQLDEMLDNIALNQSEEIKEGLVNAAEYFYRCFEENEIIFHDINKHLNTLPYDDCKENEQRLLELTTLPVETTFTYKHIVDPNELSKIEQQVKGRKSEFEKNIVSIEKCRDEMEPTFEEIAQVKTDCNDKLTKMMENKKDKLDKLLGDIPFVLNVLDEIERNEHFKKHKTWLKEIELEINKKFGFELTNFIEKAVNTDMLIKSTEELLEADEGLNFLPYRDKLDEKKKLFVESIHLLDGHLEGINKLPQEKSEEVKKKMSTWLFISLLPIGNIGILYSLIDLIKKFLPALRSTNSFYISLRETLIKRFQIFIFVHIMLIIASTAISFLAENQIRPVFYALALTYAISITVFLLKKSQLKKCFKVEQRERGQAKNSIN